MPRQFSAAVWAIVSIHDSFGQDRSNTVSVPFHPFGSQFYRFVVDDCYLLFDPGPLLSFYPIVWWLVSGFLSVTLGLARIYRVLGAHLDSTSERTRQAIIGFQLLPILLALLGGLIGFVLYYNTPKPRGALLCLVNRAEEY